jgi:Gpi18-like mannosyltransferase
MRKSNTRSHAVVGAGAVADQAPRSSGRSLAETLKRISYADVLIVLIGLALAAALRYSLLDFKSVDFQDYTRLWYNALKEEGFSAFRDNFANYNVPYLYLLYLVVRFLPDLPSVIATKVPSLGGDFALAWLAYRIVRMKYPRSPFPMLAAFAMLFAPTVVLNSAFWGQADVLYTTALVACAYFLLSRRHLFAMIMFGVSVAFKAQGVFLLPFLVGLALRKELCWRYLLIPPAVMFAALLPAWVAGRSLMDLLLIYPSQAGQYEQLSMHAPSMLSWIPDTGRLYPYFHPVGLVAGAVAGLGIALLTHESRAKLTPTLILELMTTSVMLMPFVLPKMHERYFYPADVFTILLTFYRPRYFWVPVTMSLISFFAYEPTLFGAEPVPIKYLACGVLVLLVVLIRGSLLDLQTSGAETRDAVELEA